jgi:hypothetical protein
VGKLNPVDAIIVRLGAYIAQLEAQVQELHRQLFDKSSELEEFRRAKAPRKGRATS